MLIFKGKVRESGVDPTDFMAIRCLVVFFMALLGVFAMKKSFWPEALTIYKEGKEECKEEETEEEKEKKK